jgi:hypothetical protein
LLEDFLYAQIFAELLPKKVSESKTAKYVFTNRLYIDTYLFIINIKYLSQRLIWISGSGLLGLQPLHI